jgi:hypothetical protein
MGETYPYYQFIKTPDELGASPKGTMAALKKDIQTLGDYVDVLISGTSRAQRVNGPLGNKYFMATNSDCRDSKGVSHPRYVYINNIPENTSLVSSANGKNVTQYRGLVPGIIQDVMYINPSKLFSAFSQGDTCRQVTMPTRDITNAVSTETQYVLEDDLVTYPASWFINGVHPIIASTSKETSSKGTSSNKNKNKNKKKKKENFTTEEDLPEMVYYISVGLLTLYLVMKLIKKTEFRRMVTKLNPF